MKILLTGGSGFLGRNIRESFLAEKHKIISPTRQELDLADDESVKFFLEKNSFDAVIHAAGKPGHRNVPDPINIFYADMRMFMNLLKYRSRLGRLIILGSGAIYDQRYPIIKATEDTYRLRVPSDEHALYRRVSAEILENLDNVVELRIFGVFGKYEDYAIRFISNAICKTLFDLPITLRQDRKFDYIFVDDLMPVLDYFLGHTSRHKAYNLTPDGAIGLWELAERIKVQSKKDLPIKVASGGMGLEYSGSNQRLREEIKDLRLTPIGESVKKLFEWYKENIKLINKDFLLVDK